MYNSEDIFQIPHSLPALTHSVAISTRTPTAGYPQKTKYMPDYGGVLDIPGSNLKNHSLTTKLPFKSRPEFTVIPVDGGRKQSKVPESRKCLVASQYLESGEEGSFSVISSSNGHLSFDYAFKSRDASSTNEPAYASKKYAHVEYNDEVASLKHSEDMQDILIVKNEQCVKTIQLTKDFAIGLHINSSSVPLQQEALTFGASIKERKGLYIKDACLNRFNKSILGIACDNIEQRLIKIYDTNANSRTPINIIKFNALERDHHAGLDLRSTAGGSGLTQSTQIIGPVTRTFIPLKPTLYGIQQLDCIPSHLVNMIVTTAYQTALIDPRAQNLKQTMVEKMKLESFYPTELIRRTICSDRNPNQFYSLTNIHLRVFDTRFPGFPMNQVNHMLESESYDSLEMKLIPYKDQDLETLCCSTLGNLAFITFDQTQGENALVNPKSVHLPYHDDNPTYKWRKGHHDLAELAILSSKQIKSHDPEWLFSVLHFMGNNICVRDFKMPLDGMEINDRALDSQATVLINEPPLFHPFVVENDEGSTPTEEPRRTKGRFKRGKLSESDLEDKEDIAYINILDDDSMIDFEDRFSSKRAIDRFDKMQKKLKDPRLK